MKDHKTIDALIGVNAVKEFKINIENRRKLKKLLEVVDEVKRCVTRLTSVDRMYFSFTLDQEQRTLFYKLFKKLGYRVSSDRAGVYVSIPD